MFISYFRSSGGEC